MILNRGLERDVMKNRRKDRDDYYEEEREIFSNSKRNRRKRHDRSKTGMRIGNDSIRVFLK